MATIEYLRSREQVTMVYRETYRSVWVDSDPQQRVHGAGCKHDRPAAIRIMPAGYRSTSNCNFVRQGHGPLRANTATM
jgi:cation transport regulator ChaC